jgi:hypothetical protein
MDRCIHLKFCEARSAFVSAIRNSQVLRFTQMTIRKQNRMKEITITIPFASTNERISAAMKEIADEIYRGCLRRKPTKNDASRFQQRTNAGNTSIKDQYFDGRKIGSLTTTYILDIPRCMTLCFNPAR